MIGDDDPTTTGSPLSVEFDHLVERVGLGPEEISRIHSTSLTRAFCEDSTRAELRDRLAGVASDEARTPQGLGRRDLGREVRMRRRRLAQQVDRQSDRGHVAGHARVVVVDARKPTAMSCR